MNEYIRNILGEYHIGEILEVKPINKG